MFQFYSIDGRFWPVGRSSGVVSLGAKHDGRWRMMTWDLRAGAFLNQRIC